MLLYTVYDGVCPIDVKSRGSPAYFFVPHFRMVKPQSCFLKSRGSPAHFFLDAPLPVVEISKCKGPDEAPAPGGYAGAFGAGQGERGASSGPLHL